MTIHLLTTAGLTALCLVLLAAVWYWHGQAEAQRKRATATLAAMTEDYNTLRERNAHLQALHAERVRQLLAKNYTIIDSTIQWRRTGNR